MKMPKTKVFDSQLPRNRYSFDIILAGYKTGIIDESTYRDSYLRDIYNYKNNFSFLVNINSVVRVNESNSLYRAFSLH